MVVVVVAGGGGGGLLLLLLLLLHISSTCTVIKRTSRLALRGQSRVAAYLYQTSKKEHTLKKAYIRCNIQYLVLVGVKKRKVDIAYHTCGNNRNKSLLINLGKNGRFD